MAADHEYLVWSVQKDAWWGPGQHGYVRDIRQAGRYSRHEAMMICARAIPGDARKLGMLLELPVRLKDLALMRELTDEEWRDAELI